MAKNVKPQKTKLVGKPVALKAFGVLKKSYPEACCSLDFKNPLQLLVSTMLSAQCTDKRVNMVTPALFARYPDAASFAKADTAEIEGMIRSTGFYKNKAKNIKAACALIAGKFRGKVPDTMESLLELPGVARKTANIVLFNAYGKNEGIAIDTHNIRLAQRLGWADTDKQDKIEQELMAIFPQKEWGIVSNALVFHGRAKCVARNPGCKACPVKDLCPSAKIFLGSEA
ncbi:MAG TPA: endonuclease III [Candidatus Micrarchaeota archaeon]|nr:endonuclease III [Candidatus Micrarchaeota archaeon]